MASTSSIFSMYALSSSATHHIFFPPRLQLVALQQNPDCLSAHLRDQFPFDRFLGYQPNRPARPALRRIATDHGDDALLLGAVEKLIRPRSLFLVEGSLKAATVVAMRNLADRLRGQGKVLRGLRRRHPAGQLL